VDTLADVFFVYENAFYFFLNTGKIFNAAANKNDNAMIPAQIII